MGENILYTNIYIIQIVCDGCCGGLCFVFSDGENGVEVVIVQINPHDKSIDQGFLVELVGNIAAAVGTKEGDIFLFGDLRGHLGTQDLDSLLQLGLFGAKLVHALLGHGIENAHLDGSEQILQSILGFFQLGFQGMDFQLCFTGLLGFYGGFCQVLYGLVCQDFFPKTGGYTGFNVFLSDVVLCAAVAGAAAFTGIVVVGLSVSAVAGDAHHGLPAMSAVELPGQKVDGGVSAAALWSAFVLARVLFARQVFLHLLEFRFADDGWDQSFHADVFVYVGAGVAFVVENLIEAAFGEGFSELGAKSAGVEIVHDCADRFPGADTGEQLPDDGGFRFEDCVAVIRPNTIAKWKGSGDQALGGVVHQTPGDLPAELRRVVFCHALQKGFRNDSGGIVCDVFRGGQALDPVLFQFVLVGDGIIPVPGEAIQGVDDDILPAALGGIRNHALEVRAAVCGAGYGMIRIDVHNGEVLLRGEVPAGGHLLLDGGFPLVCRAVAGINDGVLHDFLLPFRGISGSIKGQNAPIVGG